jgi:uroporphyrinogen decarboxylase
MTMNKRERFLNACHCKPVDCPPVWLMRQAGRALPEYRAMKERHTFLEMVQTAELAAEVTLQPIRRFGFDAAILFSDILVIPEALGQKYHFRDTGGVCMEFSVRGAQDVERLQWEGVAGRLAYVDGALRLLKKELGGQTALIGFAGSPWTLANFMVEGGSAKNFTRALGWWREDSAGCERFLAKLTQAVIDYLELQIAAGAEALQIFDTLGGLLDEASFGPASARWMGEIVAAVGGRVPVILFSKVPQSHWRFMVESGPAGVSMDSAISMTAARQCIPSDIAIQGNLDPAIMTGPVEEVEEGGRRILQEMNGRNGFIFNLGHGLPPTTPVENVVRLVETVRTFKWQK